MCALTETYYQAHCKSIDQEEQQVGFWEAIMARYLVSHMAEMHAKLSMAACYF